LNNYAFPSSGATYRNLADAYLKNGNDELAEEILIKSVMINDGARASGNMLKSFNTSKRF
jgi:hypothetical protein